mgnify:CR=1 FL=1
MKIEKRYFLDGTEYSFSKDSVDGEPVLVARYVQNGESFAIWTSDIASLPESAEEAKEYMEADWAVEQSSALDSNRETESR